MNSLAEAVKIAQEKNKSLKWVGIGDARPQDILRARCDALKMLVDMIQEEVEMSDLDDLGCYYGIEVLTAVGKLSGLTKNAGLMPKEDCIQTQDCAYDLLVLSDVTGKHDEFDQLVAKATGFVWFDCTLAIEESLS